MRKSWLGECQVWLLVVCVDSESHHSDAGLDLHQPSIDGWDLGSNCETQPARNWDRATQKQNVIMKLEAPDWVNDRRTVNPGNKPLDKIPVSEQVGTQSGTNQGAILNASTTNFLTCYF